MNIRRSRSYAKSPLGIDNHESQPSDEMPAPMIASPEKPPAALPHEIQDQLSTKVITAEDFSNFAEPILQRIQENYLAAIRDDLEAWFAQRMASTKRSTFILQDQVKTLGREVGSMQRRLDDAQSTAARLQVMADGIGQTIKGCSGKDVKALEAKTEALEKEVRRLRHHLRHTNKRVDGLSAAQTAEQAQSEAAGVHTEQGDRDQAMQARLGADKAAPNAGSA